MSHILIVEDETIIRSALRRLLERNQYQVSEAGSVQEAQERYCIPGFDLIVSDLRLPGAPGTELIKLAEGTPVLIMTSYASLCDPQHWACGDPQRLAQVLINLLSNARDASPPGSAIRVRSEASEHTVDLIVEDEGSGIPRAIIDRLFEPFFTTKDPGEGTGLGLALVYSIVEEHYGQITIDSPADLERQLGTRIRITLPRHVEATSVAM